MTNMGRESDFSLDIKLLSLTHTSSSTMIISKVEFVKKNSHQAPLSVDLLAKAESRFMQMRYKNQNAYIDICGEFRTLVSPVIA